MEYLLVWHGSCIVLRQKEANKMAKKSNNIKVYKTRPRAGSGWKPTDPARNLKQARSFVKGGYGDEDAIIVQTGKRGDIFPYTIYTKQRKR
jgi:hypothetical protein